MKRKIQFQHRARGLFVLLLLAICSTTWATDYTYRLVVSKAALTDDGKYILLSGNRTKMYNNGTNNGHLTTSTSVSFTSSSTSAGSAIVTTSVASAINYVTLVHVSGDTYKIYDSGGKYITATKAGSGGFSRANSDSYGWTFYGTSGLDAIYEKAYSNKYASFRFRSSSNDFRSYLASGHTTPSTSESCFYLATGCSIIYDGNGKTSGSVPTDTYLYGEGHSVTVKSNSGNLAKTGGYTFAGWNTKADGTGYNYTAGSGSFTVPTNTTSITLYAKWEVPCTTLGSVNGSVNLTQGGNSVTISNWTYSPAGTETESNVSSYTVKLYKKNGSGQWVLANNNSTTGGSAGTQATRTGIATNSKSVTFTGLVVESEYKFSIQPIGDGTTYCTGTNTETDVTTLYPGGDTENPIDVSSTPFKFRYSICIDNHDGTTWTHHYITPTTTDKGTATINLSAHIDCYQFKVYGGASGNWGQANNSGKITATTTTDWTLDGGYQVYLKTGAGGDYIFTVDYSGTTNPKVGVEFASADQGSGYKIYFDKSIIDGWGNTVKYRIGNNSHNQNQNFDLVTGTDQFYVTTTPSYGSMDAWQIANNVANSGSNSIYNYHNNNQYDITKATIYFDYVVDGDITMVPSSKKNTDNGCDFWYVNQTSGMLTHTATISATTNGTINLSYTNTSGTAQPTNTSTLSGLAHRTKLTASANPSTGYKVATFTVTPSGDEAIDLKSISGETDNHILAKDATFAATFTGKQSAVTFDKNSGTGGDNGTTATYGSAMTAITAPTRTGYVFGGYYDAETDNNGSGNKYYNADGSSAATWDKNTEDATTLYANWTAKTCAITLDKNGGATNGSVSFKFDQPTAEVSPAFAAAVRVGWTCTGYYTNDATPVKVLNADGSRAGDNVSGWWTSGKWSKDATSATLYAHWENTYADQEFSLVDNLSELSAGSKIIIIDKDYATALSITKNTNNRASVAYNAADNAGFAMSDDKGIATLASATTVQVITLETTGTSNRYYLNVEDGYLYASGTSSNYYLKTRNDNSSNADQGQFNFALANGAFTVSAQNSTVNKYLRKNSSNALFSCYANSTDQKAILVYFIDNRTKYDITWANGGHGEAPTSPTNTVKVTMPALSESGWQHDGWKADQAVTNAVTGSSISAGTLIENGTRVVLGANTTFTAQWKQICAAPIISPTPAGTYNTTQSVTITCETPSGCTIRYTTDGTDPTTESGTIYTGAISVNQTTTIKAIAYKDGCVASSVSSATYSFKCAALTFDEGAGTYIGERTVTISGTEGATIRYTTDGTTTPTPSVGTVYEGPITVDCSMTLKAIAYKDNWANSDVKTGTYHINYGVTWKVSGKAWTPGSGGGGGTNGTSSVECGNKVTQLPSDPDPSTDGCGQVFLGWTTEELDAVLDKDDDASEVADLKATIFTTAEDSPNITGQTVFNAVFADYTTD